jgi:hypothetical protein
MYRTCDPGKLSLLRKEKLRYQGKEEQDAKLTTQEADYLRRHEATEVVREEKRRERAERKEKERDEKARAEDRARAEEAFRRGNTQYATYLLARRDLWAMAMNR